MKKSNNSEPSSSNGANATVMRRFYYYDENRRIYKLNGVESSRPFEIGYYVPINIISENDKEFVCEYGIIKKRSMMYHRRAGGKHKAYTEKERDDNVYIAENKFKISERVRNLSADALREVEAVLSKYGA